MTSSDQPEMPTFLRGGGEVGAFLRAFDWRAHPLGVPDGWPAELKGALHAMLASNQALCIFWGERLFFFYNESFLATFGRELHPRMGDEARQLFAEHWDIIGPQVEHVMSGLGGTWREERPVDSYRDGRSERSYFTYGHNPIYRAGAPNDVGGVMIVCCDVTEQVNTRSQVIEEQRRLRSAQRMEAVGRLTGRIAHDFNNILAIILGNAELLVEHLADDELGRPQAELVAQAAERGATMVSRLLAYAQRQHLESNRIEPGSFLQGLIGRLERDLPVDVIVELTVQGTPWPVQIDIGQLEKSIEDLLSNAADAMPDGGHVSVRCDNFTVGQDRALRQAFGLVSRQEVAPGEYVRIVVEDRGHGMSPEVLASAFEPFFTTKDIGKGTGLGLSMVLGFIRQSQGYVGVVSSPGRGTRITLLIPRLVEAPRVEPRVGRAVDTPSSTNESPSSILVVDDEPAMCRHVVAQLTKAGYRVVGAKDPREALAFLAGPERFDLLFTDILMPGGMNGRQLVEEARRHHPALKVLYTSGYTAEALAGRDGAELEADQLLTKPYRKSDLLERVRAALASR